MKLNSHSGRPECPRCLGPMSMGGNYVWCEAPECRQEPQYVLTGFEVTKTDRDFTVQNEYSQLEKQEVKEDTAKQYEGVL